MPIRKIYNWKPVIKSLLKHCVDAGAELVRVTDTEETLETDNITKATKILAQCDEGFAYFKCDGKILGVYLVLGNEPYETVADHHVNETLSKGIDEFSKEWASKKCPMVEVKSEY